MNRQWTVLLNIIDDFMMTEGELPFGQMQIELHTKDNGIPMEVAAFEDWSVLLSPGCVHVLIRWNRWTRLEDAGLRAFHQEVNMPTTRFVGLYYTEYSFVNIR